MKKNILIFLVIMSFISVSYAKSDTVVYGGFVPSILYQAGTTAQILVGGGAGVNPVWTTSTGTGAPVRAAGPTLTGSPIALFGVGNYLLFDGRTTPHTGLDGLVKVQLTSAATNNRALDIDTIGTSTTGVIQYGTLNTLVHHTVLTGTNHTMYGDYTGVTKDQADTSVGTTTIYGKYVTAANTGSTDAGTKNTYGGWFTATGDTAGTSTAYGIYAAATGADTNWAGYFNGNTNTTGTATINSAVITGGSNTFNVTNGSASLDVAAGAAVNIDASLNVTAATTLDEAVAMSSKAPKETPTLVTPVLGVATATSINKVTITQPATGATLTIADGKTLGYEEGTWTPNFVGTDIVFTLGQHAGLYTKIGNVVYIWGWIEASATATGTLANSVTITGLPFTSLNNARALGLVRPTNQSIINYPASGLELLMRVNSNSTVISLVWTRDNANVLVVTGTDLVDAAVILYFSGFYIAA
jgi:hypothetical protein